MTSLEKLYQFGRDFQISKDNINDCIESTSIKVGVSKDEAVECIFNELLFIIKKTFKQASSHGMKLKPYQKLAVEYMAVNRGMICAFDVGTGKTLTAVASAKVVLDVAEFFKKDIKVIVVTPTSLQKNFKKEMEAFGMNPNDKRFVFYTVTKFGMDYKKRLVNCSSTFLIIDEAHVFRKDYRNEFMNEDSFFIKDKILDTRTEFAIMCSTRVTKVLLLTATPFYNKSHDIINLIAMVKGIDPPYTKQYTPYRLMKENPKKFDELYGNIVLFQKSNAEEYPTRKNIIVKVVMTPSYLKDYEDLERKIKESSKKSRKSKSSGSEEEDLKGKNAFNVKMRTAANMLNECIKCGVVMNIIRRNQKTIFYSCFLNSGVNIIIDLLKKENIKYFLIEGSITMKMRNEIVNKFNSTESDVNLLIITKAGGEGLDLKAVRNIIIFERGWNVAGEEQVIGRGIRYRSHSHLPESERVVKVYYIMAVKPYNIDYEQVAKNNIFLQIKDEYMPKFDKTIVVNDKYIRKDISPKDKRYTDFGIDYTMFLGSLLKNQTNQLVIKELEKIQITKESIWNEGINIHLHIPDVKEPIDIRSLVFPKNFLTNPDILPKYKNVIFRIVAKSLLNEIIGISGIMDKQVYMPKTYAHPKKYENNYVTSSSSRYAYNTVFNILDRGDEEYKKHLTRKLYGRIDDVNRLIEYLEIFTSRYMNYECDIYFITDLKIVEIVKLNEVHFLGGLVAIHSSSYPTILFIDGLYTSIYANYISNYNISTLINMIDLLAMGLSGIEKIILLSTNDEIAKGFVDNGYTPFEFLEDTTFKFCSFMVIPENIKYYSKNI